MVKKLLVVCALLMAIAAGGCLEGFKTAGNGNAGIERDQRLGFSMYTFRKGTLFEGIEKARQFGTNRVEAYIFGVRSSQLISKDMPKVRFHPDMDAETRATVKTKLALSGVKIHAIYSIGLSGEESEVRKHFELAKEMGAEMLVGEPEFDKLDMLDELCQEYEIKLALHNHREGSSKYWHPDIVLEKLEGRSKWMGACPDFGHYIRSGIDPVEAMKKLEGKIFSVHFKDLNKFNYPDAYDLVFGKGYTNIYGLMAELKRQNYSGPVMIEYEKSGPKLTEELAGCVEYYRLVEKSLDDGGWEDLLENDLSNAIYKPGGWAFKRGELSRQKKKVGFVWTKDMYGDFVIDLEFKVDPNANSGVFFRASNISTYKRAVQTSIEAQILDSYGEDPNIVNCGAIYDRLAPRKNMAKKTGEWNRYTIICNDNIIYVVLNGEQVINMDIDLWVTARQNPDGTKNKFETATRDMERLGHIGFQEHGEKVYFRNIRIKPL